MVSPVLKFKRGLLSDLPLLNEGEPGFTTDYYELYVGSADGNKLIGSGRYWNKETSSSGGSVKVFEATSNGTNFVGLAAATNVSSSITFTLPSTDGSNGDVLTTDGSGNLSFSPSSSSPSSSSSFNISGNSGSDDTFNTGQTLTFLGSSNDIVTTISNNQVEIGLRDTVNITTELDVPTIEVSNIEAKDGSSSITIANSTGSVSIADSLSVSGNTRLDGNLSVGALEVGSGTTDVIVNGDMRVTGILSVGQGTITLNSEDEEIRIGQTKIKRNDNGNIEFRDSLTNRKLGIKILEEFNSLSISGVSTLGIVTGATYFGDGTGINNVDADQLDGQEGTYYLDYSNFTNTPTIPSNVSDLTNDSGFITTSFTNTNQLTNGAGFITTSFTNTNQLTNGAGFITSADGGDADQLDGQEGTYYLNYNNFTNTPTIPSNVSDLTNDSGFITSADGGDADQLDGQEGTYYLNYNNFTNTPTIPSNLSDLTNDSGFITTSFTDTSQLTNGAGFITTSFTDTSQLTNGAGFITTSFTNTNQLTNGAGFITTSFTNTNQLTNGAGFITSSDNITGNSSGLSGNPNISVSEITALSASFSGNVSIGGTLTYEDVTNVDSVGLITARNGIDVTGNITVTGTVDGRDVASDGTKLDGIESGATADQTASEILTAIKTVDGASSGLDADTLDGQEGTYYLNYNNFTNTPTIPSNVSDLTNDSGFITTSFTNTNQLTNGAGFITTSFTDTSQLTNGAGFITSADGGNADTLDGQEGTYYLNYNNFTNTPTIPTNNNQLTNGAGYITSFDITTQTDPKYLRSDASDTASGTITFTNTSTNSTLNVTGNPGAASYNFFLAASNDTGNKVTHFVNGSTRTADGGANAYTIRNDGGSLILGKSSQSTILVGSGDLTYNANEVWHAGNDGSGSGLDADLLDGIQSGSFLRSDLGGQQVQSYLTINDAGNFSVLEFEDSSNVQRTHVYHANSGGYAGIGVFDSSGANRKDLLLYQNGTITWNNNTVWHAGNDGSGSGLDADTLDGVNSGSFLRSDANDSATGLYSFAAGAFGSNVTYGGRSIQTQIDINSTSMRGGVLVRNANDFRSETDSASFMHYDAYNTSATSYAFRAAKGTTLADTFWVKGDGTGYFGGNVAVNGNSYVTFGPNASWSRYLRVGGNGYQGSSTVANIATTNGNLHIDAADSFATYLNFYAGTAGVTFGNGNTGVVAWMGPDGDLWKGGADNSGSKYWHAGNDGAGSGLDADTLDGIQSTGFLQTFYETALNSPDASGGSWVVNSNSTDWGQPKFGNSFSHRRYADGSSAYVQYNIPSGYKSCWISQLQWSSGGYADCYGVQSDGDLIFLKRINTRQTVENTNHGDPNFHDGSTVTHIGSGLEHYTAIRIQNKVGRIHLTGIAWTKNENVGYEGTGMVHPAQISHQGAGSGLDADTLDGISSASFLRSDTSDTTSGDLTISNIAPQIVFDETDNTTASRFILSGGYLYIQAGGTGSGQATSSGNIRITGYNATDINSLTVRDGGAYNTIWHAGNDGSGSGLDADLLDGLQLHTGRNNEANKVVRTDANGYIQAGWINSTSGDRGSTIPARIYGSNDAYIRYYDLASFRSFMNVTAKANYQGREQNTADTNYWTGSMGWGQVDLNTVFHYGSGDWDSWSTPANRPSSATSHWNGSQVLHYTNGTNAYGYQIACGSSAGAGELYIRTRWGTAFSGWSKIWNAANDGAGSGLDADTLDGTQLSAIKTNSSTDTNQVYIRNGSPTIYLRDTDHRSSMIHCNSNLFYVLRGSGNDSTSWATVNSNWPLVINLENNDITGGRNINAVGNVTAYSSDRRLKENFKHIDSPLEKIKKLNGYNFDWKEEVKELGFSPDISKNDIGLIAQEVQEVVPQAVAPAPFDQEWNNDIKKNISKSGEDYLTVKYDKLVPLLVEAIKELKAEVETLKAERN